ncbi:hypothetical protein B0H14DRAFT_2640447 [Mycena olivaceomarginata]|nr:hypothetical protein B0H14DRAFT_2640447 [Mycena olivaceomarginata]
MSKIRLSSVFASRLLDSTFPIVQCTLGSTVRAQRDRSIPPDAGTGLSSILWWPFTLSATQHSLKYTGEVRRSYGGVDGARLTSGKRRERNLVSRPKVESSPSRVNAKMKNRIAGHTVSNETRSQGPAGIHEKNPIHRVCDEQTETRVKHACATKSKPCKIVKFAFGLWRGEELDGWNYELRGKVGTKKQLVRANTLGNYVRVQCKLGSALWPRVKAVIPSDGKSHSLRRIPLFQSTGVGLGTISGTA